MPVGVSTDTSPRSLDPPHGLIAKPRPLTAFQGANRAFNSSLNGTRRPDVVSNLDRPQILHRSQTYSAAALAQPSMEKNSQNRKPSPSHVAALLAHHRANSSQDVRNVAKGTMSRHQNARLSVKTRENASGEGEETSSILSSTRGLIEHYEAKNPTSSTTQSVRYVSRPQISIRSPVPIHPLHTLGEVSRNLLSGTHTTPLKETAQALSTRSDVPIAAADRRDGPPLKSKEEGRQVPNPPAPRRSNPSKDRQNVLKRSPSSTASRVRVDGVIDQDPASDTGSENVLPFSVSSQSLPTLSNQTTEQSLNAPPARLSMRTSRSFDRNDRVLPSPRQSMDNQRTPSHQMSVDSLANAIVASSLASSRAPSPSKQPPMPPPPSHRFQLFQRNHSHEQISRTPSPAKTMRHTMRAATPLEESENQSKNKTHHHRHHHLVRKHPNKHHEGDRKRYRTQIADWERRRYEGVWAANKGILIPSEPSDANTEVLNVVVRDIWRRSRLPDDVLEEVWDLVSVRDIDRLNREEFVVGLWLIDQRLRGNKLPIKVSESIWGSVRRLEGIKIPKQKH